jgi:uncharacterized protein (TIGR04141 family)
VASEPRAATPSPSLSLPAWRDGESENAYNNRVADEERPDWLCLDTRNVANPLRPRDQVEICDLLMPDGALVLVKRAGGSGPLSHLFNQARVAVELLQESARVRAEFTAKVARLSRGELGLPDDFTPKRIVLAMLLKNRENLTPDSIFGFSQITIAQTARPWRHEGWLSRSSESRRATQPHCPCPHVTQETEQQSSADNLGLNRSGAAGGGTPRF